MDTNGHSQGMGLCQKSPAGGLHMLALIGALGSQRIKNPNKNSLFIWLRSLGVLSLAVPATLCSGNRPFTDQTLTNNLLLDLAQSVWDQLVNC